MITSVDEKILLSFESLHFLTVEQVCSLHYRPGSSKYVNERLRLLTQAKYLQRLERESINVPYVYCLGRRGIQFIREYRGGGNAAAFEPSEHHAHSGLHMRHWLATTDFLIAAHKLPTVSTAEITTLYHDLTLKQMLKPSKVVPDGWLDIRHAGSQTCVWLELDRGTEEQKHIQSKARAIVDWCNQHYTRVFNTHSLTVCFATTAGESRSNQLATWIDHALRDRKERGWFLFTPLSPGPLDPRLIFFQPIWKRLGDSGLVALL